MLPKGAVTPVFIGACAYRLYLWILQADSCGYCKQTHVQDLYTMYIDIIYILLYLSGKHNEVLNTTTHALMQASDL